jgi:hypothetical protein
MLIGDNERRKDKNASAFFSVMGRRGAGLVLFVDSRWLKERVAGK